MNDKGYARPGPGYCQVCGWPFEKYGCTSKGCQFPVPEPYASLERAAREAREAAGREFGIYRALNWIEQHPVSYLWACLVCKVVGHDPERAQDVEYKNADTWLPVYTCRRCDKRLD